MNLKVSSNYLCFHHMSYCSFLPKSRGQSVTLTVVRLSNCYVLKIYMYLTIIIIIMIS